MSKVPGCSPCGSGVLTDLGIPLEKFHAPSEGPVEQLSRSEPGWGVKAGRGSPTLSAHVSSTLYFLGGSLVGDCERCSKVPYLIHVAELPGQTIRILQNMIKSLPCIAMPVSY